MSITDKIITTDTETVRFADETPSGAYMVLTDAVVGAKYQDGYDEIHTEQIDSGKYIGTATYKDGEVTELEIDENILAEYGVRSK